MDKSTQIPVSRNAISPCSGESCDNRQLQKESRLSTQSGITTWPCTKILSRPGRVAVKVAIRIDSVRYSRPNCSLFNQRPLCDLQNPKRLGYCLGRPQLIDEPRLEHHTRNASQNFEVRALLGTTDEEENVA